MLKRFLIGSIKLVVFGVALAATAGLAFWFTIQRAQDEREVVVVPELYGLDTRRALSRVNQVGLRLVIEDDSKSQYDTHIPLNSILKQDPAPGTRLKADRRVRVTLSLGPHDLYVPRVVGEPVSDAQVQLHESGLTVGALVYIKSRTASENSVIDQQPSPEDGAQDGVVNLLVSAGSADTLYVSPDFIGRDITIVKTLLESRRFKVKIDYENYPGDLAAGTIIRQRPLAGHQLRRRDLVWLWAATGRRKSL